MNLLYDFDEILRALNSSEKNGTPIGLFLLTEELECLIGIVQKVNRPGRGDQRETRIILQGGRRISFYQIQAVCPYEEGFMEILEESN